MVTLPQKLRHMVTSPHFAVRESEGRCGNRCRKVCWGVGGGKGRYGKRYEGRCRKEYWGVGEDVGKSEGKR